MPSRPAGATVWLTGLPGAGKTTIARTVADLVGDAGEVALLDGDELRATLSADLGFSRPDRDEHVRRVGFVAELLTRHGVLALVPVIAPYARRASGASNTTIGTVPGSSRYTWPRRWPNACAATPKASTRRRAPGRLTGLTGVDDVYERPATPNCGWTRRHGRGGRGTRGAAAATSQVAQRPGP